MRVFVGILWGAVLGCVLGCAPPVTRPEASSAPPAEAAQPGASAEPSETAPASRTPSGTGPLLADGRAPDPKRALPAVSVRSIGMHIGGGTNTSEEKAPFLGALEGGQLEVLRCYRHVERPGVGGTFGADLFVPRSGGQPEVRALRHKLGGPEFEDCMRRALLSVKFPRPAQPTVLSYSLRFDVSEGS